ncbi:type 4 pilus major pilin [Thioalkalivibrio sp. ALE16]|uniref:type 4 pilus major pilin n=1 Tax=Thioalkalivibrio sp. ALE16 TaxID=1158172 RepID=UPI0003777663|nr:type 4 pilus major pilin [Thioalkalivibrio sp. ALE16]
MKKQSISRSTLNARARKSKGFTLIEVLIVLAIGAGILFAVFAAVSKVQGKAVAKEASETLNLMVADTRALYRSQGNFNNIDAETLVNNNVPPRSMVNGSDIISPWNTAIAVDEATINTTNDAVRFTYPDVPRDDCTGFVQAAEGSFTRVEVGGSVVKDVGQTMEVATLGQACSSADFVDIAFTQGR